MTGKAGSRLLMIGSDTAVVSGTHGAFWNTLSRFHEYWDRIDVICPYVTSPTSLTVFDNVHFHPLPKSTVSVPFHVLRQGREICRRHQPDLIVAQAYGMQRMALGGLLLSHRTGIPLVVEVHHVDGYPKSAQARDRARRLATILFLRAAARHAKAFRVTNKAELVPLLRSLGIEEARILPLYAMYIDQSVFRPDPAVEKTFDLVFVGRLVPNKALPVLLDAFELIKRQRPQASFLIVGRGPLEGWLHERLAGAGMEGVRHVRWVEVSQLADLYRSARLVVCASYAEGGPRFVVEAMACGLPAVSTPVGLMKEIVKSGENGYLTRTWAPEELSAGVLKLLGDEDLYRESSAAAVRTVAPFEKSATIERYAEAFLEIAAR